jgi:DNA repair photolyase
MIFPEHGKIISRERKGEILAKSSFGCLRGTPAINVTHGCLFQCAYCYARGYPGAPRPGEVEVYINLPQLLRGELTHKRSLPDRVIFNTASDCFQPHPDILRVTYEAIQLLLESGVTISFLTKGEIPRRFLGLFQRYTRQILAQVGLVSLAERYQREYEPFAAPPSLRFENIRRLKEIGIHPEIRMDPIIPFVTDLDSEVSGVFRKLKTVGVERVTVSYLHIRPAIQEQINRELSSLHQKLIATCYPRRNWTHGDRLLKSKLLSRILRERRYQKLQQLAQLQGIEAQICQCKNPDLKGSLCSSKGAQKIGGGKESSAPLPLFRC